MKVILLKDVENLGVEGDLVDAKTGYARNFLIPRGFAIEGTEENIKDWKVRVAERKEKEEQERQEALELKDKMDEMRVTITVKAGEEGRIFGSVTSKDIAKALQEAGVHIERRNISLDAPIKDIGEHTVPVRIYAEMTAHPTVVVEAGK